LKVIHFLPICAPVLAILDIVTDLFLTLVFSDFSNNQLTGEIPKGVGNLYSITEMYLNNNQLSGKIPEELGDIFLFTDVM
jgi:hypothetical protein